MFVLPKKHFPSEVKMNKAVIYARYSSDTQTEQSIEGQLRVCQQYAKANNILIVGTYIDRAMTGTNDLRPDFQRMIKDSSKHQWDMVLVYKLDRFSRDKYESTIHKHTLKENGVKLVSAMENIPDSPEGIILESLLEGMNQYFSAELSQKVLRGMRESYLKGNYTGGILLYGFNVIDKKVVIDEQEGPIVKEIFAKFAQGYTVVEIADNLKSRGIRTKKGEYLIDKKIYRMLGNTKYTGKVRHGDTVYSNIYPQLIDERTWQAVQKIRNANKHLPGQKKDIYEFILSGKLICGDCKQKMVGISGTSHTGARHYYYTCLSRPRKRRPCGLHSVGKQYLEDIVIQTTWRFLAEKNTAKQIAETLYQMHERDCRSNFILKSLENQRSAALKATQNLISAIEQGFLTEQTKVRLKELETQISQLDFDIEQEKQRSYTYLTPQMIEGFLNSVICGDIENMEIRKAIVKVFIREIILYNDKIVITYNFCDTFSKHQITKTDIKAIEKQSETAAFSYSLGSNKLSSPAPRKKARLARVFCVTWGEGEKSGIPRRSRAEAAKHGAEKGQKPFPPTKPSRAQPADNPLLCATQKSPPCAGFFA